MKSTVINPAPLPPPTFPKLMKSATSEVVILATEQIGPNVTGTIVAGSTNIGYQSKTFVATMYVEFNGEVRLSND